MNVERRLLVESLPNYEVAGEIGRGGWGVVLEASHKTLNRQVAVKQLPRAFGADPEVRARFLAEARMVASLDHPHIVPLYDFVERDGMCLLVMEYMAGGTLWDRFQAGELSPQDACAVSLAVLSALAHAHERDILHRDVKPENVLFNAAGVPKLADFGIAKVLGDASSTRTATGVIMGTPAYMAPEQGLGRQVTAATDVYAVGVMLYELLSGDLPFPSTGEPLAQLFRHVNEEPVPLTQAASSVPGPIAQVVMHALEKAPENRPVSALDFARKLHGAGTASFGIGWLDNASFPVLDSRVFGRGNTEAPQMVAEPALDAPVNQDAPEENIPPSNATIIVADLEATGLVAASESTTPEPTAPEQTAPEATFPETATQEAATPQTSAPTASVPVTPPPTAPAPTAATPPLSEPDVQPASPPKSPGPARYLLIAIAAVALVIVSTMVFLRGGNNSGDPSTNEIPVAAIARLEGACLQGEVAKPVCDCAVELAQQELTVAAFMANDALLQRDGDSLTAPMEQIFVRCQEQYDNARDETP